MGNWGLSWGIMLWRMRCESKPLWHLRLLVDVEYTISGTSGHARKHAPPSEFFNAPIPESNMGNTEFKKLKCHSTATKILAKLAEGIIRRFPLEIYRNHRFPKIPLPPLEQLMLKINQETHLY